MSKILTALIAGLFAASVFAADTTPKSDTNKTAPAAPAAATAPSGDATATVPAKKPAPKHHKKHGHAKQEAKTPEAGSTAK